MSNKEVFSLEKFSTNLKEIVLKYASRYLPQSLKPISQNQMSKSSLQMLLDKNAFQASNTKPDHDLDVEWLDFAYKSSVDEVSLSDDACYVYNTLNEIVNRMHTTEAASKMSTDNGKVAIIDFSNASVGDLQFLMQLFTGCSLDEAKQCSSEKLICCNVSQLMFHLLVY